MASTTNHWKLGLFVLLGLGVGLAALVLLGASRFQKEVMHFVTYFDESVQGLEVGDPVKFRGVTIGEVTNITVAPDRRHVQVTAGVNVDELVRLGLRSEGAAQGPFVPPDLRVQLVPTGLTGKQVIQMNFFDPEQHPPPGLPFPTAPNYIPAARSSFGSLEQSVVAAAAKVPGVLDQASVVLERLDGALADAEVATLSARARESMARLDATLTLAQEKLGPLDVTGLAEDARASLKAFGDASLRVDAVLSRLEAHDGLLRRLERVAARLDDQLAAVDLGRAVGEVEATVAAVRSTTLAVGDVTRDADGLAPELEETLRAVREAADALRSLTRALERDPDMLLKGRGRRED